MAEGHHSPEAARAAFAAAPEILKILKKAGVKLPHVDLHEDGSGTLWLGPVGEITQLQLDLARALVRSDRRAMCPVCMVVWNTPQEIPKHRCLVGIQSCCGFERFADDPPAEAKEFR